jgi:hypothetical protein
MAFSAGTTVCDYKKITLSKYSFWYWSYHMNFSLIKPLTLTALALVFSGAAIASDQSTYTAWSSQRGNTVNIPEARVAQLCGDIDGCEVRIAMYNWDGSGRTASRSSLFYYNTRNRAWRAEAGDRAGTSNNNQTEHVMNAWSCYFTDGNYSQWYNHGDLDGNFAVLSWNQYNATCRVTLVD